MRWYPGRKLVFPQSLAPWKTLVGAGAFARLSCIDRGLGLIAALPQSFRSRR
jgi:hypothetical protein